MSENIDAVEKWQREIERDFRFGRSQEYNEGVGELLDFHKKHTKHAESPLGKAKAALVDRIRQAVLGGEAWTFPSFESEIRNLTKAIAAEGESNES